MLALTVSPTQIHAHLSPNLSRVSAVPRPSNSSGGRTKKRSDREIIDDEIIRYIAKKAIKSAKKLDGKFVWCKKIEHEVARGGQFHDFSLKAERERQKERVSEIEKIKKRREERELEIAQREGEISLFARERARSEADGLGKQEREFELSQAKIRSLIRLRGGRAKPIDLLIAYIGESNEFVQSDEPYTVFEGLSGGEIEILRDEIQICTGLDRETPIHAEYWDSLLVICDWELRNRGKSVIIERGIHPSVETDVRKHLEGRNHKELVALESQIESDMQSGRALEVEFWEDVHKLLPVYKAMARLKEIHVEKIRNCSVGDFEAEGAAIDHEEDKEEGDAVFGSAAEVNVDSKDYWWHEKYHPRKPKYLNHVHTGYQWNKYNRIHYDHDNPPPKFVQGYKFNIFYPDLMDKTMIPRYFIEEEENITDTCIIRFHAGPPYEDVAFRIVNNEWEGSSKKGFKCTYEGGILKLYFNFKRYSYRR